MKKDSSIHSLHDSFFKKQFQDIEVARSFFENYLPKEVIQNLELENLRIASNELISKELKKSQTDILFQSKIQDRDGYFLLSLEHQKQVDPHMCLRMFEYYYQIYSNYRKQYPNKKPPLILCFVVYQGSEGRFWTSKTSLHEYLEVPDWLKPYTPSLEYLLLDLPKTPFERLQGSIELKLILETLKEAQSEKILSILKDKILTLIDSKDLRQLEIFREILYYLSQSNPVLDKDGVLQLKEESTRSEIQEVIMNAAEEFRMEGRAEGRAEGFKKLIEKQLI